MKPTWLIGALFKLLTRIVVSFVAKAPSRIRQAAYARAVRPKCLRLCALSLRLTTGLRSGAEAQIRLAANFADLGPLARQ